MEDIFDKITVQNPYRTNLPPDQETAFQGWVKQNRIPWQDTSTADYDMRGFYKASQAGDPLARPAANGHFPDTYKTPYHKTFSNESIYATPDAPHWEGARLINKSGRVIADETPQTAGDIFDRVAVQPFKPSPQALRNIAQYPENQLPPDPEYISRRKSWETIQAEPEAPEFNFDPEQERRISAQDRVNAQYSLVPQGAVPALSFAKKYLVDPFDKLAQKGSQVGSDIAEGMVTAPGPHDDPYLWRDPEKLRKFQEQVRKENPRTVGVSRAAGGVVGGTVADPRMWPFFLAGPEISPTLRTATGVGFSAQMGEGAITQAGELGAVMDDPNVPIETKWEMGAGAGFSTLMFASGGAHLMRESILHPNPEARITPPADTTPIQEKVKVISQPTGRVTPSVHSDGLRVGIKPSFSGDVFDKISGQGELFPDRRVENRGELERRQDFETRKILNTFSPEEKDIEITRIRKEQRTAPLTDLPNSKALEEAGLEESHPHIGFADVDDFKDFNTQLGHEAVNQQVLGGIGNLFKSAISKEPGNSIHVFQKTTGKAGDEFILRATTPEAISRVIKRVNDAFSSTTFESKLGSKKGTGLSHGIGETVEDAEIASNVDKVNRKALGLRSGTRELNAKVLDTTHDDGITIRPNVSTKEPMFNQPDIPQAEAIPQLSAKEQVIQRATQQFTPERLEEIRNEAHRESETRSLNALAQYGKVKQQLSVLEDRLELSKNAATKGFSRGALTPEKMSQLEAQTNGLRERATALFSEHVKGLNQGETEALIRGIEEPVYRQIGKAIQLHTLLTHDKEAKSLKEILNEDIAQGGLSESSKRLLTKYFPNEKIGPRLTRGKNGQRTRIYDKLGYEESSEQAFKLLKFLPNLDKAKGIESRIREKLEKETDVTKRSQLQASLDKTTEVRQKFEDIHNQVASAREIAHSMAESETDPRTKAFLDRLIEKRKEPLLDQEGNLIAKAGEYKLNPIIMNPKVKATPRAILSKFADVAIPGEVKEISQKNLVAILGKSGYKNKLDYLRPHEKQALTELAPSDMKSPKWYATPEGRTYMRLKQGFIRTRVEEVRDKLVRQIQNNIKLVSAVKGARGIPTDHLTPLETAVTEMLESFRRKEATPSFNKLLSGGDGLGVGNKTAPGTITTPEASKVEGDTNPILRLQKTADKGGEPAKARQQVLSKAAQEHFDHIKTWSPEELSQLRAGVDLPQSASLEEVAQRLANPKLMIPPGPIHDRALGDKIVSSLNTRLGDHFSLHGSVATKGASTNDVDILLKGSVSLEETKTVLGEHGFSYRKSIDIGDNTLHLFGSKTGHRVEVFSEKPTEEPGSPAVQKAMDLLLDLPKKNIAALMKEAGLPKTAKLIDLAKHIAEPDSNPNPEKPSHMPEGSQAEKAITSTFSPTEAAIHERAKGLEKAITELNPSFTSTLDILRKGAEEIGNTREYKYRIYETALVALKSGIEKGDPYAMFNAAETIRRPQERGTIGPSRRTLTPDEIKESYRVYSHLMLKRYEGMSDLTQARMRDNINDGVLEKAVKESGDQNVKDRFLSLLEKVGTNDPIQTMGTALINGVKITPEEAAKGLMRNRLGEMKLDKGQLRKKVEDAASRWDKAHIADSTDFIAAMEAGDLSKFSQEDQVIGKTLRDLLDNRRAKLQNLGKDYLKTYIQDYFPHLWSNVGKARSMAKGVLARRPLAGDSGFLKEREYDTFKEGLATGLQPLTWNPVKMALTRIEQIDKFLAAHKMADDFKKNGLVKYVRLGGEIPSGWVEMEDKIFRAEKLDEKSGALMTFGKWYAPPEVAKVFNNHLSPGLNGNKAYNIVRMVGNAVNQSNLILGVFHLIESGFNITVSDLALALKAGAEGQFKIAAKSLARMPVSVIDAYFNSGKKMMAEAMSPGKYAEYARSVDYMKRAGGTLQMDPAYLNQAREKFRTNLKTTLDTDTLLNKRLKAGVKLPITGVGLILEKANWFVMEHFVPRMKAAAFHRMAEQIHDKMGDSPNEHLLNKEVDDAWDSVDNRLGELVYDNLFWNRVAKDVALVTFRSTGWNLGTVREIGGGVRDVSSRIRRRIEGEKGLNLMSHRTAYTIALTGTVMMMGAAMTYLSTGRGPQELTDYFYPPDGTTGPDGKPNRQYLKTYVHDVGSFLQHPLSTVSHKASPLWSQAFDVLWANADFYGREIRHPGDSFFPQVKSVGEYLGQSSMPFFYQNFKEEQRRDATTTSKIESLMGILPAPKWAGQSKAEALSYDLAVRSMPQTQDKDTFDRVQRMDALRNKYAHGNTTVPEIVKAVNAHDIRYEDARTILGEAHMTPLQRHVSRLTAKDALRVWDKATPDEQKQVYTEIVKKYRSVFTDYQPEEQAALQAKFREILETMRNKSTNK
jgi:GGDEF domain-containing protein